MNSKLTPAQPGVEPGVGAIVAAVSRIENLEGLAAQVLEQAEALLMRLQGTISVHEAPLARGTERVSSTNEPPRSPDILSRLGVSETSTSIRLSLASERLATALNLVSS